MQLTINGIDAQKFVIVYADSQLNRSIGSATGRTIGEDISTYLLGENSAQDFDRQSAERLKELFQANLSIDLQMQSDRELPTPAQYEILVGKTNREASKTVSDTLGDRSYLCAPISNGDALSYVVCGGSFGATWHAINALEALLQGGKNDTFDLVDTIQGDAPLKAVACLGDSITRGSQSLPDGNGFGTPDGVAARFGPTATSYYFEQQFSYPANLGRALWKDYLVYNFGQGLSTMRNYPDAEGKDYPFYYRKTGKYKSCLAKCREDKITFDAVLIMLGTNDSGKEEGAKSWSDAQKQDYMKEAEALLSELSATSPNAKFVLMNVPHRCNSHKPSENDDAVRALQKQTAQLLLQKGYAISHFNMNAYTADHLGVGHGETKEAEIEAHADYYNIRTETGKADTTHPNFRGYYQISLGVRALLSYLLEGGERPIYMIDLE